MTPPRCERLALADLTDYVAGDLPESEAAAVEAHLFACGDCGARAAELDAMLRAIHEAMAAAGVGGFVTDAILNRLAREGVRVRSYVLSPGAVVPCAVWTDDDVMVLRLRGDLGDATEVTLSRRVAGREVGRVTGPVAAGTHGEVLFAEPAPVIRQLPVAHVELVLTARHPDGERLVGHYTLVHGGPLER